VVFDRQTRELAKVVEKHEKKLKAWEKHFGKARYKIFPIRSLGLVTARNFLGRSRNFHGF
jgi:hypothetical protein